MSGLIHGLTASVRSYARSAAITAAFCIVGLLLSVAGFFGLTAALWVLIATYQGMVVAYATIGALFLVLGVIFLVLAAYPSGNARRSSARQSGAREPAPPPPPREPLVQIAEGFAIGMQAGRAARGRNR